MTSTPAKFRSAAVIAGALTVLLAAMALVGWNLAGGRPLPGEPGGHGVIWLVTIGVGLSGLSLILLNSAERPQWAESMALGLGIIVVVLGALSLMDHLMDREWSVIGAILEYISIEAPGRAPGRSSLLGGVGIMLFGAATTRLVAGGDRAGSEAQLLGILGGFIGLAVAIGYIYGSERFAEMPGNYPLSLNAALGFILLALGILASTPWVGAMRVLTTDDMGGRIARRLIPVAVLAPIILQWLMQGGVRLRLYTLGFGVPLVVTTTVVVFTLVVWQVSYRLSTLDERRTRAEEGRSELLRLAEEGRAEAERVQRLYERRARQEEALRRAAEAVTAAFTVDDVVREISRSALEAAGADISFVELIHRDRDELEIVAATGEGAPELGVRTCYTSSLAAGMIERDEPIILDELDRTRSPIIAEIAEHCPACSALLVPLRDFVEVIGVLVLIRRPDGQGFDEEEVRRTRTFATLATLAFRKISLLEDAIRRSRELEEVTESRARLIRGFSHDLKNPLGAADGYAQLLDTGILGELEERQHEGLRRIRGALHSALDLIGDLVELARSETGQIEIEWVPTDLGEIVDEVTEEHRAAAESGGLELRVELPEEGPRKDPEGRPVAITDGRRIRQIMGNLLSNAVKYTGAGGRVIVSVRRRATGPGERAGDWYCLAVEDNGPGIPRAKQEILFQEFVRLSEEKGGVGLGLAISQRVARLLGGELDVESEEGRGSIFTLWIPARPQRDGARVGPQTMN